MKTRCAFQSNQKRLTSHQQKIKLFQICHQILLTKSWFHSYQNSRMVNMKWSVHWNTTLIYKDHKMTWSTVCVDCSTTLKIPWHGIMILISFYMWYMYIKVLLFKIFNMLLSYMHSPKDADGMISNYGPIRWRLQQQSNLGLHHLLGLVFSKT